MSTSIGNANVYQFLARTTVRNGKEWQKQADNNGDGLVSYNEFVDFIEKEYSSQMDSDKLNTRDLNIFWNSIDTDKTDFYQNGIKVSGAAKLDAKEIAKMDAEMQDYIDLETAISLAIANKPSEFSAGKSWSSQNLKDWNSLVSELITAEFEAWRKNKKGKETFEDYMKRDENLERILLQATGEIQTDIEIDKLMTLPEWQELAKFGYNIGEDKEIDAWIKEYINQYIKDNNLSLDTISANHKDIIDAVLPQIKAYLEEKQKITTDDNGKITDTSEVGTKDVPTDAQRAALKAELTKEITTAANTILASLNLTGDFTDIIAKFTDEYRDSLLKIHLIGTSEGYNALKELTADNIIDETAKTDLSSKLKEEAIWLSLKNNIKSKFENDFENTLKGKLEPQVLNIVKNKNLIEKVKNDILSNIKEFTNDSSADYNQLWANKIEKVALGKIGQLLANELQGGYGIAGNTVGNDKTIELDTIDTIYKDVTNLVVYLDDENEKLRAYAELAVGYMNEVVKMGYSDVAKEIVGNNYKNVNSWVNTGDVAKINDLVDKVKAGVEAKIKEEKYAKYTTTPWSTSGKTSVVEGNELKLTVSTSVKNGSTTVPNITYGLKGDNGLATITTNYNGANGEITVSKDAPSGPLHLTVYAMVDGHEVGTAHNITINVTDSIVPTSTEQLEQKDFMSYGAGEYIDTGKQRTTNKFLGIKTYDVNPSAARTTAINQVNSTVDSIKDGLSGKDLDANLLEKAATMVKEYFKIVINKMDPSGVAEIKKTYTANGGYTSWGEKVEENWFYRSRIPADTIGNYRSEQAGIQWYRCCLAGNRWDKIIISKDLIIDKFIKFYNQLVSGEVKASDVA